MKFKIPDRIDRTPFSAQIHMFFCKPKRFGTLQKNWTGISDSHKSAKKSESWYYLYIDESVITIKYNELRARNCPRQLVWFLGRPKSTSPTQMVLLPCPGESDSSPLHMSHGSWENGRWWARRRLNPTISLSISWWTRHDTQLRRTNCSRLYGVKSRRVGLWWDSPASIVGGSLWRQRGLQ